MIRPVVAVKRWTLLLLLAFTAGQLPAQLNPAEKIPFDPKVKTGKLSNGLTYYIRQNKKPEQKIELRLVLNAGSINEDNDQRGLAHMAEHMAFNGTKNFKKNEIVTYLQNIGVGFGNDLNAHTSFDETVYILPIPIDKPGNLEKGFQILEDWAHNVSYFDEDINSERPIILEESRMGKNANDRMFKQLYPKLFAGSKYGERLPIGLDTLIKTFKPDAIRRFYKDWYRPNLMAVIVVGDIEPAKAEALIKKHFAALKNPANERKREYAEVPAYTSSSTMVVTDKEATGYNVSINYPVFNAAPTVTIGDYRDALVKNIFVSLVNQRLGELTQQQNPPFLSAGASFGSYARGYDAFGAYASSGTGDIKRAMTALMEELERVKRFGFTAAELDRARKSILAAYERAYNNRDKSESGNYVEEYVHHFLEQAPSPGIEVEYEYAKSIVPGITLEEVNAVSKKFREQQNRFVYVTGPEGGANLPAENTLLATLEAAEKADIKPYEEKVLASSLLKEEPKAGKVLSQTEDKLLGTTIVTLSNGVTVTLKPTDFKDDQILIAGARPGGKNNYGAADRFNTEWVTSVVGSMGMGDFSPVDLRKVLAGKSVGVQTMLSGITTGVSGSSGVKDLETLFQLIYLTYTAPRVDEALFRSFVDRNKSQFANILSNPDAAFSDTLNKILYNDNPLAPLSVPHSEYFDRINLDRTVAIYKELFGNVNGANFVITGSFKTEEMLPLLEKYIASLPSSAGKLEMLDNKVRMESGKHQYVINKGKEQKSLILALYADEMKYTDGFGMKIRALSEVLNIRIVEELREKIQGIYGGGTSAGADKLPYSNYSFVLQLPCGPEKVDTLIKAVKKEFAEMAAKGPDATYLDKVKKQWIEKYRVGIKDNGMWLNQLLQFRLQGGDPDRFLNYEKYVNALTPKDVQEVAKLIFEGKNEIFAIQMPEGNTTALK